MQFYLLTSFLFPRSLRMRLFALCFIATHVPLLGYIGWGMATGRIAPGEVAMLTIATACGMAIALLGIGGLLHPIHALAETLHRDDPAAPALPSVLPPLLTDVGDIIHTLYAGVQRAAAATRAEIEDLRIAAHEDSLTGIANRRGFLAQLDALPDEQRRGCIAIIDIDHFKQVNDQMGHCEGDRILREFAGCLSAQIRRADKVARWGGEEFAIFFEECIEDEASWSLARIAARMRDQPVGTDNGRITFSAGIARWGGGSIDDALRRADDALYEAKRAGRDQIKRAGHNIEDAHRRSVVGT